MKYIQLNDTDLNVSRICLGTEGFGDKTDQEKSFEILDDFVRAGGNFIDTANVYCKWLEGHGNCSEQIIGKWLKDRGAEGKVIVATKGAHYSFEDPGRSRVNREDIRADLDESLRTLGTEVIDFYWLHRDDPEKPVEEIVDILEELKKDGTIDSIMDNYIGEDAGKTPYESPEDVDRSNGTLIMATNAEFEPYEYREGDTIVGIDADIAQAICDKLGYELEIDDMEFDAILAAVQSGKADFGAAGMTVTEDRLESVDFTDTYANASQVIIVKK